MRTQNSICKAVLYFTISCLQTSTTGSWFLSPGYSRVSRVGTGFLPMSHNTSYNTSFIPQKHNSEAVVDGTENFSSYSRRSNDSQETQTYKIHDKISSTEFRSRYGFPLPSKARSEVLPQTSLKERPLHHHASQLSPQRTQTSRMQPPLQGSTFRSSERKYPYKPVIAFNDRKYDILSNYYYSSDPSNLHYEQPKAGKSPKPQNVESSKDPPHFFEHHYFPYRESHNMDGPPESPRDEHSNNFQSYIEYNPDISKEPPKKDKSSNQQKEEFSDDFPKYFDYHPDPPKMDKSPKPQKEKYVHDFPNYFDYHTDQTKEPPNIDKSPKKQIEEITHNFPSYFHYHLHSPKESSNIEKPPKPQEEEFPHDFPKYLEYHAEPPKDSKKKENIPKPEKEEPPHDFESYLDYHPVIHHEEPTTTTEEVKEQTAYLFSFYGIGYKLFYVPLYAGIIFVSYVLYLILRSQTRHKVLVPYDFITNPQTRNARALLDDASLYIIQALETTKFKY